MVRPLTMPEIRIGMFLFVDQIVGGDVKMTRRILFIIFAILFAAQNVMAASLSDIAISNIADAIFISDQFPEKTVLSAHTSLSMYSFRKIPIADLRGASYGPSLEKNGFALVNFLVTPGARVFLALGDAVKREAAKGVQLRHEDQVNEVISAKLPAFEALIASWARANLPYLKFDAVFCDSPVYRNTDPKLDKEVVGTRLAAKAVPVFHIDFVEQQCMQAHLSSVGLLPKFKHRLQSIIGDVATKDDFWRTEGLIVETLNIWMPLNEVRAKPLALMDITTLSPKDVVETVVKLPSNREQEFRSFSPRFQKDQKFYFWSDMSPGEAIIFKSFRTPHAAVDLASDKGSRESLDLRCYFIRSGT